MEVQILEGNRNPSDEEVEELFSSRELGYYTFSNSAGDHYAPHSHGYNKLLLILRGSMRWTISGTAHTLSAGTAIILPAGTVHEVDCLTDCACAEGHF